MVGTLSTFALPPSLFELQRTRSSFGGRFCPPYATRRDGLRRGACQRARIRATSWLANDGRARMPRTINSAEARLHATQPVQLHGHAVAGLEPDRLDEASGEHDLAGMQATA